MLRLRNCLLPLLRAASPLPFSSQPHSSRLFSISTSPSPAPFTLEGYLVASCGLDPAQAREVSKKASRELSRGSSKRSLEELSCSRLNSASNPDAILGLLSRADITTTVSADSLLLRASVNNTAARLLALRKRVGLSAPQITRFLLVDGSRALRGGDVVPKLEFFIFFYGSFEQVLEFLQRAEELGVPARSPMFRHTVDTVARISKEKVAAKLEFLKSTLGCFESKVSTAVPKMPNILGLFGSFPSLTWVTPGSQA